MADFLNDYNGLTAQRLEGTGRLFHFFNYLVKHIQVNDIYYVFCHVLHPFFENEVNRFPVPSILLWS